MTRPLEAQAPDRTAPLLAGFYFAWASALGSFGPFVAAYLEARGYSPRGATLLLAVLPLMRVVATPAWTYAADLFRAVTPVLRLVSMGSLAAFALLAHARGPVALALALVLYNTFRAPIGALADAVLLEWAARKGGSFGRVRAWGSAGFLLTAVAVARVIERAGHDAVLVLTQVLLAVACVSAWLLPGAPVRRGASVLASLRRMMASRAVRRILTAGAFHQMGLATYDNLYATWMTRRAGAVYTGASLALGVVCEIVVMVWGRGLLTRLGSARALRLAFAAGALRWALTALSPWPVVVACTQSLHALSFALWYLAAVDAIHRAAPEDVRASAQGVHATVVIGFGAAASLAIASALGGTSGAARIFLLASACSAMAAWIMAPDALANDNTSVE